MNRRTFAALGVVIVIVILGSRADTWPQDTVTQELRILAESKLADARKDLDQGRALTHGDARSALQRGSSNIAAIVLKITWRNTEVQGVEVYVNHDGETRLDLKASLPKGHPDIPTLLRTVGLR